MTFLFRRALATMIVLWGVCSITFLLLHFTPGDPVELLMGDPGSGSQTVATEEAAKELVRHELGLDKPLVTQYLDFFLKLSHGDLGVSYTNKKPIIEEIKTHLPSTLALAFASMIFAITIGLPLGFWGALTKNKWVEGSLSLYAMAGLSMPSFWIAPLLIIFFSIKLNLFPVNEQNGFISIVLPALSLGIGLSAVVFRMTRASLLEILNEDYIRVARSKGLTEKIILFKHALKNALSPIVTILSLQFGAVLTGVVITETIFDWPGLGILLYGGLKSRNYPVVQGCVLCIALIYIFVNFVTDIIYFSLDPRLKERVL